MLIHQSAHATIEWLEAHQAIIKTFRGFIQGNELKNAFHAGYDAMKAHHGCKWLSDNRGLPVYRKEDIDWINSVWFPKMLQAGWKYWALLEPESAIGEMTMTHFEFYANQGVRVKAFNAKEDALAWLDSVT